MIADLCSVSHIGIFAREASKDDANDSNGEVGSKSTLTPKKSMSPNTILNGGPSSSISLGGSSPLTPSTPMGGSEVDEFPAFVPPVMETVTTPRLGHSMQQAMASSSTFAQADNQSLLASASKPSNHLAFLAYIAGLCTALPFEDDEPLQLCAHLSKLINTHGASLQAQMQQTMIALKKLNGEHVDQAEEEDITRQLAQPIIETNKNNVNLTTLQEKSHLLTSLNLQCQSAMAITILIQLRQWLQNAYELAGLFDSWSVQATGKVDPTKDDISCTSIDRLLFCLSPSLSLSQESFFSRFVGWFILFDFINNERLTNHTKCDQTVKEVGFTTTF